VNSESSQCSYRLGIRAAAIRESVRARNWQSQRVTPRSGVPVTVFHPDPAHRGQTSVVDFMISIHPLCNGTSVGCNLNRNAFCVLPVQTRQGLWRSVENAGGVEEVGEQELELSHFTETINQFQNREMTSRECSTNCWYQERQPAQVCH